MSRGMVGWLFTPGRRWWQLADIVAAIIQARRERRR